MLSGQITVTLCGNVSSLHVLTYDCVKIVETKRNQLWNDDNGKIVYEKLLNQSCLPSTFIIHSFPRCRDLLFTRTVASLVLVALPCIICKASRMYDLLVVFRERDEENMNRHEGRVQSLARLGRSRTSFSEYCLAFSELNNAHESLPGLVISISVSFSNCISELYTVFQTFNHCIMYCLLKRT